MVVIDLMNLIQFIVKSISRLGVLVQMKTSSELIEQFTKLPEAIRIESIVISMWYCGGRLMYQRLNYTTFNAT